jgi:hypothetical protein
VPTLKNVFDDFARENRIHSDNFEVVGSVMTGGLSNAWGCGVARFDTEELSEFPFPASEFDASYQRIATRIGISGKSEDDLSAYCGVDQWSRGAIPLNDFDAALLRRYQARAGRMAALGFRVGRARMAVLAEEAEGRGGCELLGTCLWGCSRNAMYSAQFDLQRLREQFDIGWRSNFIVDRLERDGNGWIIHGHSRGSGSGIQERAHIAVLAAGCLATNRIAREALGLAGQPARLYSNPSAGFLVWFPLWTGSGPQKGFASAQLSFTISSERAGQALFGGLFPTAGIPVSEFADHLPFARRYGVDLLRYVLPSSIVGNLFLSGAFSRHEISLSEDRSLHVKGGFDTEVDQIFAGARRRLAGVFRSLGGILPRSAFVPGTPGSDVHYAGGLPMRAEPKRGECSAFGEVAGLERLFVADAAGFPSLPAKPLTLTIMANADRIATQIARSWS